jgi:hypothetical protein
MSRENVDLVRRFYDEGLIDPELVQDEAHTWTVRDGRIARFEWGKDLSGALRSAGLRP